MKQLVVMPNQSLLDMTIQGYGTLEAAMQMAQDNDMPISFFPDVSSRIDIQNNGDQVEDITALNYLYQNALIIATKGVMLPLTATIVLNPRLIFYSGGGDPTHSHIYGFKLEHDEDAFIHVYDLLDAYLARNKMIHSDFGYPGPTVSDEIVRDIVSPMYEMAVEYVATYFASAGNPLFYFDLSAPVITTTYKDVRNNEAYFSPVFVLEHAVSEVIPNGYLIADSILVETLSNGLDFCTVRLTRSHPLVFSSVSYTMNWLGIATSGTPDPLDPTNDDKTILTLTAGSFTIGVQTGYIYSHSGILTDWPNSAFTMAIEVS